MKILKRNDGFGTIETVILIAVLIGLAVIFRENILKFINMIFDAIFEDADDIIRYKGAVCPYIFGG